MKKEFDYNGLHYILDSGNKDKLYEMSDKEYIDYHYMERMENAKHNNTCTRFAFLGGGIVFIGLMILLVIIASRFNTMPSFCGVMSIILACVSGIMALLCLWAGAVRVPTDLYEQLEDIKMEYVNMTPNGISQKKKQVKEIEKAKKEIEYKQKKTKAEKINNIFQVLTDKKVKEEDRIEEIIKLL